MYLQKKYAAKYADEGGPQFEALVDRVFEAIQQEFRTPSWHPEAEYQYVIPCVLVAMYSQPLQKPSERT